MSAQKGARSKLADVLADIKNSRADDEYDYNNHEVAPTPAKRRHAVNYVALSGHTPRQSRSSLANTSSISTQAQNQETKTPHTGSLPFTASQKRTYVLKLFGREVDLAQFAERNVDEVPLYPIFRAWANGRKTGQDQSKCSVRLTSNGDKTSDEESPETSQPDSSIEPVHEVHNLPPPKTKSETIRDFNLNSDKDDIDIRIPESVRNFKRANNLEETFDKSLSTLDHYECFEINRQRWKRVKKEWSDARRMHESRYEDSFKVLSDLFMSQRG